MSRKNRHLQGWVALLIVVIIADLTGDVTMSDAFTACSRHRKSGAALVTVWAILTAHLFGLMPRRYDPIHNCFLGLCAILHSNSLHGFRNHALTRQNP